MSLTTELYLIIKKELDNELERIGAVPDNILELGDEEKIEAIKKARLVNDAYRQYNDRLKKLMKYKENDIEIKKVLDS